MSENFSGSYYLHSTSIQDNSWAYCTIQVQVAHLQPDEITLVGEGVFPRVGFDLPSQLLDPEHSQLRETAQKSIGMIERVSDDVRQSDVGVIAPDVHMCFFVFQSLLLEMERLLVKQFVTKSDSPHMNKGKLRLF